LLEYHPGLLPDNPHIRFSGANADAVDEKVAAINPLQRVYAAEKGRLAGTGRSD